MNAPDPTDASERHLDQAASAAQRSAHRLRRSSESIAASQELLNAAIGDISQARAAIAELQARLQTNRLIGMAIGIVMVQLQLNQDQAMAKLTQLSQMANRRMRDVAIHIVTTGQLPT